MTYAGRILDALGDSTRRVVFARLQSGERSVGEIAEGMDVSRPAVSQHLKVLKAARLVTDRAEGTRRLYAVDPRGINALRSWLDGFWSETLSAFKEAAEREATKEVKSRKRIN
jgi:DNA-binding transcriptional ArsR family regulator